MMKLPPAWLEMSIEEQWGALAPAIRRQAAEDARTEIRRSITIRYKDGGFSVFIGEQSLGWAWETREEACTVGLNLEIALNRLQLRTT